MAAGLETTAVSKQFKQLEDSRYIVYATGLLIGVARNRISYVRSLSPFNKNRSVLLVRNSLSVKRNILFIKERNIVEEYFSESSLFHARTLSLISFVDTSGDIAIHLFSFFLFDPTFSSIASSYEVRCNLRGNNYTFATDTWLDDRLNRFKEVRKYSDFAKYPYCHHD